MNNNNKLFLCIFTFMVSFLSISCSSDDNTPNDDDTNSECDGAICTAILIQINVSITDQDQNPVALDTYTVTNLENGDDMTISLSDTDFANAQETGRYPLTQDGVLGQNEARRIQFRGFIDNEEVVRGDYTVSTDCCHVSLDSGDILLSI